MRRPVASPMALAPELRAQILRLFEVEHWRVGTIARQLRVHHETVRRMLKQAGVGPVPIAPRASRVDPYLPFIRETLAKYPTLTASRLHAMVCERGYVGSADHFRHRIAGCRPRPSAEAYLRLRTLPGEQAQVDWAHFGHHTVGRARRPLMAFVMVLSHSRMIFLRFLPLSSSGSRHSGDTEIAELPRLAIEHTHTSLLENRQKMTTAHRAAVVIPHHPHDRNADATEELSRKFDFADQTAVGNVTRHDQHVGPILDAE
mgnify:CR=1 FL=1